MRPTVRNGVAPATNGDKPMLSGAKTVTKTVILLAALMLIVAGSFIWSRSGSTELAVQTAKPAEASAAMSPLDIMSQPGKDLPVEDARDPF